MGSIAGNHFFDDAMTFKFMQQDLTSSSLYARNYPELPSIKIYSVGNSNFKTIVLHLCKIILFLNIYINMYKNMYFSIGFFSVC